MSTRQAEEVLEHTFRQLEQMVKDVRRQKADSERQEAIRKGKMDRKRPSDSSRHLVCKDGDRADP